MFGESPRRGAGGGGGGQEAYPIQRSGSISHSSNSHHSDQYRSETSSFAHGYRQSPGGQGQGQGQGYGRARTTEGMAPAPRSGGGVYPSSQQTYSPNQQQYQQLPAPPPGTFPSRNNKQFLSSPFQSPTQASSSSRSTNDREINLNQDERTSDNNGGGGLRGQSSSSALVHEYDRYDPAPNAVRNMVSTSSIAAASGGGMGGGREDLGFGLGGERGQPVRSATDPETQSRRGISPPGTMREEGGRDWRRGGSEGNEGGSGVGGGGYDPTGGITNSGRPSFDGSWSHQSQSSNSILNKQRSQQQLSNDMNRLRIVPPSPSNKNTSIATSPSSVNPPNNIPLPGSEQSHSQNPSPSRSTYPNSIAQAGPSRPAPPPPPPQSQTSQPPPDNTQYNRSLTAPSNQDASGSGSGSGTMQGKQSNSSITPGSICESCGKTVKGQFVRAMGKVYHLDCFRCKDCGIIVASKFFPVEDSDGSYPLCERDYFARLDLICAKCDKALRGSYITACAKKYHVEHFTCSVCETVFGPQDSYYEHDNEVYCHFHYSTRFAVKCVGCANAILKQFVEINRNQTDECWHPECYMIHKFWNVKLISKFQSTPPGSKDTSAAPSLTDGEVIPEEQRETPESLRATQQRMENQVDQIWNVLSAFEESSAACISEMLRFVSGGEYSDAISMAEKFIFHVEALFAAIDDLEAQFEEQGVKGMSHAREAKMLCRKTVNFFSLLARTPETNEQRSTVTKELLALVTGLAHYLKILIRIALTGSLKLDRDHGVTSALDELLARLTLLAKDEGDPTVQPRGRGKDLDMELPPGHTSSTRNIAYGYRSLAIEAMGETALRGQTLPGQALDNCMRCHKVVDEDCVRLGLFERWHGQCIACDFCDNAAATVQAEDQVTADGATTRVMRRSAIVLKGFEFDAKPPISRNAVQVNHIACAHHRQDGYQTGFELVSRLEQYGFLLNVALRELFTQLRSRGFVVESPPAITTTDSANLYNAYRDSGEIKRLKSVNLDRKLSATARMPQRSTIIESPSGKMINDEGDASASTPRPAPQARTMSHAVSVNGSLASPATATGPRPDSPDVMPNSAGRMEVIKPAFARNNTDVRLLNDETPDTPKPAPGEGSTEDYNPTDEEGVTLGDIPSLLEAEQNRLQSRRSSERGGKPLLSELTPLEAVIVKHFALMALQRTALSPQIDLDDLWELVEVKRNGWWNKFLKAGKPGKDKKDKKEVKRKGTFGVPLDILVEKTGSDSQLGASDAQLRVPEFIDTVICAMKQMDMSIEGIFRKNGNIKRLNAVSEAMDRDAGSVNFADDNPVQLAALLKKFLRDLPDPLMTFKLHKLFCAAQHLSDDKERNRCLHLLVCLLPRYNRDTMEVLFVFLKWVASFSHVDEETGSRMDIANLATVICPSILYAKGTNALRDDSFVAIKAVQNLVENQDEYYPVPAELTFVLDENVSSLFANSIDLAPKDIYRACSNYATARRQSRAPSGGSYPPPGMVDRPRMPEPGYISSYRSENNLASSPIATGQARLRDSTSPGPGHIPRAGFASTSRPSSWVEISASSNPSTPLANPTGPMFPSSSGLSSSPRRFQGPQFGGRSGSVSAMPPGIIESETRTSMSTERVRSPAPGAERN